MMITIAAEIMAGIWLALAVLALYVSHRMRFVPLLFVATAALPWIVFYAVTLCDCWVSVPFAVAYSRWANAWAAVNLAGMLLAICRSLRRNGLD